MTEISYVDLSKTIRQVFLDADKYKMDKYVPAFEVDGKYQGDCFNYTIFEPRGAQAPLFYHVYSPYDIISKKAPQRALVFDAGELILDADIAAQVRVRTAVMSGLVIQALGHSQLHGRVLFIGTGNIAREALRSLKAHFPELTAVDFVNTRGSDAEFAAVGDEVGVKTQATSLQSIGEYDYIICHTSAHEPVLTAELRSSIKPGALIASFVSEDFCELSEEYYAAADANVIIDWDQTIAEAPELQRAVDAGVADPVKIIRLKDLLSGAQRIDDNKKYTVYRTHGTPMQNLAVLKLLMEQ